MRALLIAIVLSGCATTSVEHHDVGTFSVQDYLKTAYDTLLVAETDTDGHRIRAQLEARAALDALRDDSIAPRRVPYAGAPSLAVALELLERSEQEVTQNVLAQTHTKRAVAELRQALQRPPQN